MYIFFSAHGLALQSWSHGCDRMTGGKTGKSQILEDVFGHVAAKC